MAVCTFPLINRVSPTHWCQLHYFVSQLPAFHLALSVLDCLSGVHAGVQASMPTFGTVTNLPHGKLTGQKQHRFFVPLVLRPVLTKNTRQTFPVGVCLATQGGSRKLSQAARDYAAGIECAARLAPLIPHPVAITIARAQVCERGLMKMI